MGRIIREKNGVSLEQIHSRFLVSSQENAEQQHPKVYVDVDRSVE